MNQSVKFTIITITYNAAQWLERTILSILSQSYGNIEYVIIDGASTDGTVDIIRQYAPGVSFWLSEPDKGLYDAMNKGLQHATGDYVWFINAGDTLPHADIMQRIVQKIEKFRMGMLVCHQSFIVRREIAPLYDLNYRLSADYDWCIRCLKEAKYVCNTNQILSNFLEAGMSTQQRKASLKERYAIMCKYYGKFATTVLHGWFAVRFYTAKLFKGRV